MGTGVQDDDSTLRSGLQVLQESGKVEAAGNRVPVSVLTDILKVGVPKQKSFNYSIDLYFFKNYCKKYFTDVHISIYKKTGCLSVCESVAYDLALVYS